MTGRGLFESWLQSLLMFALAFVLILNLVNGNMQLLLHPNLIKWQWLSACAFFLFGFLQLGHSALQQAKVPAWSTVVFAVPVVLFLVAPPVPLGADVLDRQGYYLPRPIDAQELLGKEELPWLDGNVISMYDDVFFEAMMALYYYPEEFRGYTVNMLGFTVAERGVPQDHVMLSRLVVRCHVACAIPEGLYVYSPELKKLGDDMWVQISGVLRPGRIDEREALVLYDVEYVLVDSPASPYVFIN